MRYSDGDQKDLEEAELTTALGLYFSTPTTTNDYVDTYDSNISEDEDSTAKECMSSGSDDEESYVPSPEVKYFTLHQGYVMSRKSVHVKTLGNRNKRHPHRHLMLPLKRFDFLYLSV